MSNQYQLPLSGAIGVGSVIMNDYTFTITEDEDYYTFTVTRGSEQQSMTLFKGPGNGNVQSEQIKRMVVMDRADYDALTEVSPTTLYLIRG